MVLEFRGSSRYQFDSCLTNRLNFLAVLLTSFFQAIYLEIEGRQ